MGSFGMLEIILLVIIGVLVFGGDLPEVGRKIGRIWGKIKHYITMLQEDIEQETTTVQDRIDIEQATEEPYYSRQQSPETRTPESYEEETSDEPEPAEHDESEASERLLSEVIEEDEGDKNESSSNPSSEDGNTDA